MNKCDKCCLYLKNKLRKVKIKKHIHDKNFDIDFWDDVDFDDLDDDIKEAVIEYVRDSDDLFEWSD